MSTPQKTLTILALFVGMLFPLPSVQAQSTDQVLTTDTFIEVADKALPSVVSIYVEPAEDISPTGDEDYDALLQFFMDRHGVDNLGDLARSTGSGVVVKTEGRKAYVMTNAHVVSGFNENMVLKVALDSRFDKESQEQTIVHGKDVTLLGVDKLSDLAVLELEVPEEVALAPLEFADSDAVKIGEWVLALGNPLDLNNSLSQGIISAKGRQLSTAIAVYPLLQTTAIIQPGNSGGPLVNLEGKVVGINNAIITSTGYWQGVGFAIPSNEARFILNELVNHGRVRWGFLGIEMRPLAAYRSMAETYNMQNPYGVLVTEVVDNSPADRAGLEISDVITHVDGTYIRSPDELKQAIATKLAEAKVDITVVRLGENGKPATETLTAELTELPDATALNELFQLGQRNNPTVPQLPNQQPPQAPDDERFLGLQVEEYTDPADSSRTGLMVEAISPGSPAAQAGLRAGDLVMKVNGRSVRSEADFKAAMMAGKDNYVIVYDRDGDTDFTVIRGR